MATRHSLSVVIPSFNEPDWILRAVGALRESVQRAGLVGDTELLVVDDGSEEDPTAPIAALDLPFQARVLRQENLGRFLARRTGIEAASGEYVLLIDARVRIAEGALSFVADELDEGRVVWNAHIDIDLEGNPFARFWNVLTEVGFREYFSNPRTTSFGLEEFDQFPKGTTCFLAPRELLLGAIANFDSMYEDLRHSSDDTTLIRWIAAHERVWISPRFSAIYVARDAFKPFLRHAYHRGTVFPDSFGPGTRFFPVVVAFYPISAAVAGFALRKPKAAIKLALAAPAAAGAITFGVRRSVKDALTLAWLAPLFTLIYSAGLWRGLWLIMRARYSRARADRPR